MITTDMNHTSDEAAYREAYTKGWRYSATPSASIEYGDSINAPDAWYDGYLDYAAGRDKWHDEDGNDRRAIDKYGRVVKIS